MSHMASAWAREITGISGSAKTVLMLLADCHNGDTWRCDPRQERLIKWACVGRSTVLNALAELEAASLIRRFTRALGRERGSKTFYLLNTQNLEVQIWDLYCLEVQNLFDRGPDFDPIEVQYLDLPYKEEPEIEPEEEPCARARKSADAEFEKAFALYRSSPLKARQTKKRAREAWKRATSKTDASTIIAAIEKEVRARANCDARGRDRGTGEFVGSLPDMHRWLRDERWKDVEADNSDDLFAAGTPGTGGITDMNAHKLDAMFRQFAATGDWGGARYGWYEPPNDPRADYPAELYAKHNLKKPGEAA